MGLTAYLLIALAGKTRRYTEDIQLSSDSSLGGRDLVRTGTSVAEAFLQFRKRRTHPHHRLFRSSIPRREPSEPGPRGDEVMVREAMGPIGEAAISSSMARLEPGSCLR